MFLDTNLVIIMRPSLDYYKPFFWPVPVPMSRIRVDPRYFSGFVHRMVEDKNLKHHLLTSHNTQLPDLASSEERNNDIMF